jgi:hypothetical protein
VQKKKKVNDDGLMEAIGSVQTRRFVLGTRLSLAEERERERGEGARRWPC